MRAVGKGRRARPGAMRSVALVLVWCLLTLTGCGVGPGGHDDLAGPSGTQTPAATAPGGVHVHHLALDGRPFAYCAGRPLEAIGAGVTRVILAIHGLDRAACEMREAVVTSLGGEPPDTLVVAPHFATASDVAPGGHFWSPLNWPAGEVSNHGLSSYAALDALVAELGDREVVVLGFSGGGQFVNRWAALSPAPVDRYVVINPSSYLYFSPDRAGWDAAGLSSCPAYDRFRYGLADLPAYAVEHGGAEAVLARYPERHVRYLIGTADDDPDGPSLDRGCEARTQGSNREERALNYHRHLEVVFGPRMDLRQPIITVPGVGHDVAQMLDTRWAREALTG